MGSTGLFANFMNAALGGLASATPASLLTSNINLALLASTWTPSQGLNKFWSDISINEVTGTNYSAGGQALTSKALAVSGNVTTFTAANVTWASSTISNARYAALYLSTGTSSTSWLIGSFDFGSNQSSVANNFVVAWNASGVFALTAATFA